jgi:hypothetical protein
VRSLIDGVVALPFTLLPRRYWQSFDLPVASMAPLSGFVMLIGGFAIGLTGYFAYLEKLRAVSGLSILEISQLQVAGKLPETIEVSGAPAGIYMTAPFAFALFSPLGLLAVYLVASSIFRIASSYIDEAHGDPILTAADAIGRRAFGSHQKRTARASREQLEGAAEPDRRYDGAWAGLADVDFVIVSARRKPEWTKGTWVTTDDGWFVLGEPFDRPMPNGLRTVYPLTAQTTLEVVRKSVQYKLPPLRPSRTKDEAKQTI